MGSSEAIDSASYRVTSIQENLRGQGIYFPKSRRASLSFSIFSMKIPNRNTFQGKYRPKKIFLKSKWESLKGKGPSPINATVFIKLFGKVSSAWG